MTYLLLAFLLLAELQTGRGVPLSHIFELPGIEKELDLKPAELDAIRNAKADSDLLRREKPSNIKLAKGEERIYKSLMSANQFKRARQIQFQDSLKFGCIPAALAGEGIEIGGAQLDVIKLDSEDLFERVDTVYKRLRYEQSKKLFSAHFDDEKLDVMFGPRFEFKEAKFGRGGYAPKNFVRRKLKEIKDQEASGKPKQTESKAPRRSSSN